MIYQIAFRCVVLEWHPGTEVRGFEPAYDLAGRQRTISSAIALQAEGIAILFIEQNVRLALSMAGRGYILESGRLAIEGDAPTLINSPEVRRIFLGG